MNPIPAGPDIIVEKNLVTLDMYLLRRCNSPGCDANTTWIRTPYGLRTTVQQCKQYLLSTKSHSIAWWPTIAALTAMAAMAVKSSMGAALSSPGIRDYSNRTIHRLDTFATSSESSLAGVQDEFGSTWCQHPWRSSDRHRHLQDKFWSASA